MIRINLLSKEEQEKAAILMTKEAADREALDRALYDFHHRPANLRNPESKKVKCHQCRSTMTLGEFRKHEHTFMTKSKAGNPIAIVPNGFSSFVFKGKRQNPHFSKKKLLLVERVRELMPKVIPDDINQEDMRFLIRETRIEASRELRKEWKATAKQKRDMQKASRRLNRAA